MRKPRLILAVIILIAVILTGCSQSQSAVAPEQSKQVFVGSANSNKYHYPDCKWALKIKPENKITFDSSEEAKGAGYVPCKACSPP